ncbi:MAG: PA0069 family radical SAM protein [Alphaproteobacteria bacterium]|nr:PA0069 family radical SAM protein [Alphaproteobacteria bacterium]
MNRLACGMPRRPPRPPGLAASPDPGETTALPAQGRGSLSNASGRFEKESRVLTDDGWGVHDAPPRRIETRVSVDASRSIITRNQSPDISFDRSINPYRGCEHGCFYCFARPTHAYLGLSPGLDFETRLFVKPKAAELLRAELADPIYVPKPIAIGTNTDPYQPIERDHDLMREILSVLREANHPVTIVTKSALVARDVDLLASLAKDNLTRVALSVTTLDRDLARAMEPRASTPAKRLEAIRVLSQAGVPTGVMFAPVIPALNDWELERVLAAAAEAGAELAGYVLLRLPLEIKDHLREWLAEHRPDKAQHVLSIVRQMRGGRDYDAKWGERMRGTGEFAEILAKRFRLAVRRYGLGREGPPLDVSRFRRPNTSGQLSFL